MRIWKSKSSTERDRLKKREAQQGEIPERSLQSPSSPCWAAKGQDSRCSFLCFWLRLREGSPGSRLRVSWLASHTITALCYLAHSLLEVLRPRDPDNSTKPQVYPCLLPPLPNPSSCELSDRNNLSIHPMAAQTKEMAFGVVSIY